MKLFSAFVLLLFWSVQIDAQKTKESVKWIDGTVLNSERKPVKRAIIYLDSVKTKIKTNKKGQFRIRLKESNKTVSAYSWNYGIKTNNYDGESDILIVFPKSESILSEEGLEELGFKTMIRRTKKEPKDYSEYLNMYQLIATEVPGAMVSGTTIRLRGVNSVQNGQDPLILVDGTPTSSIETIFPREVASVKVIRDQGTSLYGVRGSNGVILIEMKK